MTQLEAENKLKEMVEKWAKDCQGYENDFNMTLKDLAWDLAGNFFYNVEWKELARDAKMTKQEIHEWIADCIVGL